MATPKLYLDSCCLIEAIKGEIGKADPKRSADLDMLKRIIRAGRDGKMTVLTSLFTVAEVIKTEEGDKPIPEDLKKKIERLILSGQDGLTVVSTSPMIVTRARDLAWDDGMWTVKPPDRLHLASALISGAKEFLSWDNRLGKKLKKSDLKGMRFVSPSDTSILPAEYRANDLFKK